MNNMSNNRVSIGNKKVHGNINSTALLPLCHLSSLFHFKAILLCFVNVGWCKETTIFNK